MELKLQNYTIAILVANGFEQVELTEPKQVLEEVGATTQIVSPETDTVKGWQFTDWGESFSVDVTLDDASPNNFDALVLPGGVMNPDNLRTDPRVQEFVRAFFNLGKPVATICHGPWTLIDAGVVSGRTLTSYHTIKTDLKNAGATWIDREVVVDKKLVSSRNPNDLPTFNATIIQVFSESPGGAQQTQRRTTAEHESFMDGAGTSSLGYDSPPSESSHISNEEYHRTPEPDQP